MHEESIHITKRPFLINKLRDYFIMMKPNLSFMVAFSSVIGYLMVPDVSFNWWKVLLLFTGGMLVTNASNIINQTIERFSDRAMKRTRNRPLPDGRMGTLEARIITLISAVLGLAILSISFNVYTGLLSFISLLLYGYAYTPMKKISSIATFVGAIPGAFPPLIGWVAGTGTVFASTDLLGWILFAIQFFWQFPHFWAIAWLAYDEYLKAGIMMLPSKDGRTSFTGLQCMFYSLPLLPLCTLPYLMGASGFWGMIISLGFGIHFFIMSALFYLKNDKRSAKGLLYSSFIYLPGTLLALVIDKM